MHLEVFKVLVLDRNSVEYLEQIVENPVPQVRREGGGGLQGSLPVQNSAAVVEQIVDIPARRGLPDFLPGQGFLLPHRVVCTTLRMRILQGFSHFSPFEKKCEVGLALGVGTAPRVELMRTGVLLGDVVTSL